METVNISLVSLALNDKYCSQLNLTSQISTLVANDITAIWFS